MNFSVNLVKHFLLILSDQTMKQHNQYGHGTKFNISI